MLDLDTALLTLREDFKLLFQRERERQALLDAPLHPAMKDERDQYLKADIERQRQYLLRGLRTVVDFPPQHGRHALQLPDFHAAAPFGRSVFVMTKFPDPVADRPEDRQLRAVIQAVREAVRDQGQGHVARLASDRQFHPGLWDNVELYLLGCARGIAIVEDRYRPELNPNVAMEWGWMRGMGRQVLYLVEQGFDHARADWGSLIEARFDWDDPAPGIRAAVQAWLASGA